MSDLLKLRPISRRAVLRGVMATVPFAVGLPGWGDSGIAPATAAITGRSLRLGNGLFEAHWEITDGRLRPLTLRDRRTAQTFPLPPNAFQLTLADGRTIGLQQMRIEGDPVIVSQAQGRADSASLEVRLFDEASGARCIWRPTLRSGARYVRQEIEIEASRGDLPIREITLIDLTRADAHPVGTVKGSPVVCGNWFLGFEHPLSTATTVGPRFRCLLSRTLPIPAGHRFACSSIIGCADNGQMRRGFQAYIERERPRPYRPFLHYNSWYDIGFGNPYTAAEAVDAIDHIGTELSLRRGVMLDSFLFDDGWDDTASLWRFNTGFPDGFAPLKAAAARFRAAPGVWLSPWGGYGGARDARVRAGKAAGFETEGGVFALSGPKYYERFRDVCAEMVRTYGINQFKFDGTGSADRIIPGSTFDSDFDAAIHLIDELRAIEPQLYVNLTTGTYPSPFWLRYADSIWRGGADHNFAGVGSNRQQWITYRDAAVYAHTVVPGPLFPINSLMLHGLIFARQADRLQTDPAGDFRSEIRSYFGSGTQCQEMYITPRLLGDSQWNDLAEAALWARANADTLIDAHWIGGDPAKGQVYGRASWSPRKGILSLRNPGDRPQRFALNLARAFELPAGAPRRYLLGSPWKSDAGARALVLDAGQMYNLTLQPFEVLTLEGVAVG